jgi:hypothetical protein
MKKATMLEAEYQNLIETSWRRPLTAEEEKRLRELLSAAPPLQGRWEQEAALNRLLGGMPPPQISTNFTARVMEAVRKGDREPSWAERLAPFPWLSRNWIPRMALTLAMVCCGVFSFHEYQAVHRAQLARELARATKMAALPPLEWMKDFDTISRLDKVSGADNQLLAALQ